VKHRNAHLNLIDSSRHLFELDAGVAIEAGDGWLFGAGSSSHPLISNAAFRSDDELDAGEFLARARDFFAPRNRGFAIWARDTPEDRDLSDVASAAGLDIAYEMPAMVVEGRVEDRPPPRGIELTRIHTAGDAEDFWRVAADAYRSNGFPPEVFAHYEDHEGLWADDVSAFLARQEGEPVSIAMTIVNHGVAGIYWVGSTEKVRGRGLGWTMTATAVNTGLEMGVETAALQASPMGEPLYRRMGFETAFNYRLLHHNRG
jgi:GNAT superfamily N-acetyltransferase